MCRNVQKVFENYVFEYCSKSRGLYIYIQIYKAEKKSITKLKKIINDMKS